MNSHDGGLDKSSVIEHQLGVWSTFIPLKTGDLAASLQSSDGSLDKTAALGFVHFGGCVLSKEYGIYKVTLVIIIAFRLIMVKQA